MPNDRMKVAHLGKGQVEQSVAARALSKLEATKSGHKQVSVVVERLSNGFDLRKEASQWSALKDMGEHD